MIEEEIQHWPLACNAPPLSWMCACIFIHTKQIEKLYRKHICGKNSHYSKKCTEVKIFHQKSSDNIWKFISRYYFIEIINIIYHSYIQYKIWSHVGFLNLYGVIFRKLTQPWWAYFWYKSLSINHSQPNLTFSLPHDNILPSLTIICFLKFHIFIVFSFQFTNIVF